MLYFGHSLIDAGGNSVVQISAIDDIGKIPGFLTLKGQIHSRGELLANSGLGPIWLQIVPQNSSESGHTKRPRKWANYKQTNILWKSEHLSPNTFWIVIVWNWVSKMDGFSENPGIMGPTSFQDSYLLSKHAFSKCICRIEKSQLCDQ